MKRFFLVLFFLILSIGIFMGILEYSKEQKSIEGATVEKIRTVRVYTDFPIDVLSRVGEKFREETGISVEFVSVDDKTLFGRNDNDGSAPDLYITSLENLDYLKRNKNLAIYSSPVTDVTLNLFKDQDCYWYGVWIDPFVFVANKDFIQKYPLFSYNWTSVLTNNTFDISLTDFLSSDMSGDLLMMLIEHFGQKEAFSLLNMSKAHIVQYGRYLSTPSRLVGMGKCDIGISNYNEAIRTQREKIPVTIFYPTDGTGWYLYGVGLSRESKDSDDAKKFIDWLCEPKKYKKIMEDNNYHYIYLNDEDAKPDKNGTELTYWDLQKKYSDEGKKEILDYWMENIRFGRK